MDKIQSNATKMIPELCNFSYERRLLQQLELISLEQRLRRQLIEAYTYLNGFIDVTLEELRERDGSVRTRNNRQKLMTRKFKTSQAINFFPVKTATIGIQLSKNIVSDYTENTFPNRLDKYWIRNPTVLKRTDSLSLTPKARV
ncbi:hypothetical protein FHG87_006265 [Trinorchestia longiramus]|nr:hypothetical protein FHG87_006265 [Trinorchestia longiramus]